MARLWRVRWDRRKAVLAVAALAVALAVPAAALAASQGQAEQPANPPAAGRPYGVGWSRGLAAALGLTDQQRQEIQRIQLQAQEQLLPVTTELFRKRQELNLALRQPQPDEARIKSLVQDIGRLRTEVETARVETHLRILSVLTPEQRERLQALPPGAAWAGPRAGRAGHGFHGACGGPGPRGRW